MIRRKWKLIAGIAVVVVAIVGALGIPAVLADEGDDTTPVPEAGELPCLPNLGPRMHGFGIGAADGGELLADALGITVEELQAAIGEARTALAEQDGIVELLVSALGITIEEFKDAVEAANNARLAQAVEDGLITQEQADMIKARRDLREYLADSDLRDNIRALYEEAIQQAVIDGVITQEQADSILSGAGPGIGKGIGIRGAFGGGICGPGESGGRGIMRGGIDGNRILGGKGMMRGDIGGFGGCPQYQFGATASNSL